MIEDDSVERVELSNLPNTVELWMEKGIKETLPDPTILDYAHDEKVDLLFIPSLPLPMETYEFYNS